MNRFKGIDAEKNKTVFIASFFDLQEFIGIHSKFSNNILNIEGRTPLEIAIRHGNCNVVSILLQEKVTTVSEKAVKAAAKISWSGKELMMLLLEQRGVDVIITEEVIKAAATCGQDQTLKIIEKHSKLSPSEEDWSIAQFYNAAKSGDKNTIQELLASEVEPDFKDSWNESPLWISAYYGHVEVVQVLFQTKLIDVNAQNIYRHSPIFFAAANGV